MDAFVAPDARRSETVRLRAEWEASRLLLLTEQACRLRARADAARRALNAEFDRAGRLLREAAALRAAPPPGMDLVRYVADGAQNARENARLAHALRDADAEAMYRDQAVWRLAVSDRLRRAAPE